MLDGVRTKAKDRPSKTVLFGEPGSGKTTTACSLPQTVMINTDNGAEEVLAKNEDLWVFDAIPVEPSNTEKEPHKHNAESFDSIVNFLRKLYTEKHDRKYLVIDAADAVERLAISSVCHEHKEWILETVGGGYGKGTSYLRGRMWQLWSAITKLSEDKGITPIIVCHSKIVRIDKPHLEPYDSNSLKLNKNVSADLQEWADSVLFLAPFTKVVTRTGDFGKQDKRGVKTDDRVLYTSATMGVECKNRYSLPSEIRPADLETYFRLVQESRVQSKKPATKETE
jgi:hypothetical protein|tara:strand:+ start:675 stop:1520 length:846 start_codon:yes stop_codon:yes gene_type:complete